MNISRTLLYFTFILALSLKIGILHAELVALSIDDEVLPFEKCVEVSELKWCSKFFLEISPSEAIVASLLHVQIWYLLLLVLFTLPEVLGTLLTL